MKAGKFVQCTGRHDNLAAMVHILSLRAWKHRNGVASVVFIESTRSRTSTEHATSHNAVHGVVCPIVRSELELLEAILNAGRNNITTQFLSYHSLEKS